VVVASVLVVRGEDWSVVRRLELAGLDVRFRLRGPVAPSGRVTLVAIDEASIARFGRWPPPRTEIARVLARLHEAGAAVVVLALQLSEPAQAVPAELRGALAAAARALPTERRALREALAELAARPDPDVVLAAELSRQPTVLAWTLSAGTGGLPSDPARRALLQAAAIPIVLDRDDRLATPAQIAAVSLPLSADQALPPAPVLARAAAGLGHDWLLLDQDGSLRFDLPALPLADALYPSLAVEAVRLFWKLPRDALRATLARSVALGDRRTLATDERMRLPIDELGPAGTFPTLSFVDVHAGAFEPALVTGRIVVLGATASGTSDRFRTPFQARQTGIEHVATVIDNLLTGRSLRRDGGIRTLDLAAALALGVLAAFLAGRGGLLRSIAAVGALLALWAGITQAAFAQGQVWLGLVAPGTAALIAGALVELRRQALETRRKRAVEQERRNLARYFPPSVVERLAGQDRPRAFDQTQDAAVLFVDVVGFTHLSEPMAPAEAMALLRGLHTRVERAVFAHEGTLASFMGDGAMAVFGVPEPAPDAAARALRAARALIAEVEAWSAERESRGEPPIRVSCGLHHGPVLMGDIGGAAQFQFTTIGDTVNVASRLESMTRTNAARLIVSDAAVQAALRSDPEARAGLEPLSPVPIRGREGALAIWRLPLPTIR
jgi:adenylate cyclase